MHRIFTTLIPVFGLLLALSSCSGLGIKIDGGFAQMEMDGSVAVSPSNTAVNLDTIQVDIQDNLGLDEASGTPYGRVELSAAVASFTFSGFTMDQSGSGTIPVTFGDLSVNANVSSELEMQALKAAVHFDLINVGILRLSPGIGVDLFDIKWAVTDTSSLVEEDIEVLAPIPMVFVQAEVDLGSLDFVLDVGAIDIDVGDAEGTFIDVEAVLRYSVMKNFEIFGGYRWISLDAEGKDDTQSFAADLTIQGWMLGGGITL